MASTDSQENDDGGPTTPNLSESQYSPTPSVGSVRMASRARGGGQPQSGEFPLDGRRQQNRKYAIVQNDDTVQALERSTQGQMMPVKRVLNQRNLVIQTAPSLAHPYPSKFTTLDLRSACSAEIQLPPSFHDLPAASSSQNAASSSQPLAALHPEPHPNPRHTRRRSSEGSLTSSGSTSRETGSLSASHASQQRMQSFLGPKMKHISPAPWRIGEGEENAALHDLIIPSSFWPNDDVEIGSVHMATKTPRSRSVKEALGFGNSHNNVHINTPVIADLHTLKGLGLVGVAGSIAPSGRIPGITTTPKNSNAPTSPADLANNFQPVGSTTTDPKTILARTESYTSSVSPGSSCSFPLPPLTSTSLIPTMTVTNIVRSRSPDPASMVQTSYLDLGNLGSSPIRSTSAFKAAIKERRRSLTTEAVLQKSSPHRTAARPLTPPPLIKANDLVYQQENSDDSRRRDSAATGSTSSFPTSSNSMASLPSPTPKASDASEQRAGEPALRIRIPLT